MIDPLALLRASSGVLTAFAADPLDAVRIRALKDYNPRERRDPHGRWTGGSFSEGQRVMVEHGTTGTAEGHVTQVLGSILRVQLDSGDTVVVREGQAIALEAPKPKDEKKSVWQVVTQPDLGYGSKALDAIDSIHTFPSWTTKSDIQVVASLGGGTEADFHPGTGTIRLSKRASNATHSLRHEMGHKLDQALGQKVGDHYLSKSGKDPEMEKVMAAIQGSRAFGVLSNNRLAQARASYWLSKHELFARAYQQYIATVAKQPAAAPPGERGMGVQWEADDFEPIAAAIDALLVAKGLRK